MSDLLSASQVNDFKAAIRSVTDTFMRFPASVDRGGVVFSLLCGRKVLEGKFTPEAGGEEIDERFVLSFNRDYLADLGLVDGDDVLLLGYDDDWFLDGKRFFVLGLKEDAVFRDEKLLVFVEVGR